MPRIGSPGGRYDRQGTGLVGRDGELARLRVLYDDLRAVRGGAVLVAGVPGIGKTALVHALPATGLDVVDVTGAESEIDLPFAGLGVLLEPLREHATALPAARRASLDAALAGAPPSAADPAGVLQAATALVAAAAAARCCSAPTTCSGSIPPRARRCVHRPAREPHRGRRAGGLVAER